MIHKRWMAGAGIRRRDDVPVATENGPPRLSCGVVLQFLTFNNTFPTDPSDREGVSRYRIGRVISKWYESLLQDFPLPALVRLREQSSFLLKDTIVDLFGDRCRGIVFGESLNTYFLGRM